MQYAKPGRMPPSTAECCWSDSDMTGVSAGTGASYEYKGFRVHLSTVDSDWPVVAARTARAPTSVLQDLLAEHCTLICTNECQLKSTLWSTGGVAESCHCVSKWWDTETMENITFVLKQMLRTNCCAHCDFGHILSLTSHM